MFDIDNWNSAHLMLSVEISPLIWRAWWIFLPVSFSLGWMISNIFRQRIKTSYEERRIRNEIARDLHDQIGSTLSGIAIYASVAKMYGGERKANELHCVLNHIVESTNEVVDDMGDIVWTLETRNDNVKSMARRLEAYALSLCMVSRIQFQLDITADIENIQLDMKARKNLYLIAKEAINNAIKYAHCNRLTVTISLDNKGMVMMICDNGIGFDVGSVRTRQLDNPIGSGIGNMKLRARELQSDLKIVSIQGEGTSVSVLLRNVFLISRKR